MPLYWKLHRFEFTMDGPIINSEITQHVRIVYLYQIISDLYVYRKICAKNYACQLRLLIQECDFSTQDSSNSGIFVNFWCKKTIPSPSIGSIQTLFLGFLKSFNIGISTTPSESTSKMSQKLKNMRSRDIRILWKFSI